MIDLPILTDWKKDSYDTILVIINCLTKMIHHKSVKIMIEVVNLAKIIIDMIVDTMVFQR